MFTLLFTCSSFRFLYLFLASSHQLYAELWLDSFSFAGPLGGVRTTTSLAMLLYLCLYCIFRLLSGCLLLPLFRHLFTFLYICFLHFIFFCGLYTPSLDKYCTIDDT